MKCYVHPNVEAVGVCGACCRGLCAECAAEVRRRLACRGHCEERVGLLLGTEDATIEALGQAKRMVVATRKAYIGLAVFLLVIGLSFITVGHLQSDRVFFVAIMGYVFVAFAVVILIAQKQ